VQFMWLNLLQNWNLRQAKADRHRHVNSTELSYKKTAEFLRSAAVFNMNLWSINKGKNWVYFFLKFCKVNCWQRPGNVLNLVETSDVEASALFSHCATTKELLSSLFNFLYKKQFETLTANCYQNTVSNKNWCSLNFVLNERQHIYFINHARGPHWENIGLRSWQYGPSAARFVQKRPRADILPVRSRASLVNKRIISRLKKVKAFKGAMAMCNFDPTSCHVKGESNMATSCESC